MTATLIEPAQSSPPQGVTREPSWPVRWRAAPPGRALCGA